MTSVHPVLSYFSGLINVGKLYIIIVFSILVT